jgi:hypothetical protein
MKILGLVSILLVACVSTSPPAPARSGSMMMGGRERGMTSCRAGKDAPATHAHAAPQCECPHQPHQPTH